MDFYEMLKKYAIEEDNIEKIVAGAIITNDKGEVFVPKRKKDDFLGGYYEIVGGHEENNAGILKTLIREVKEETNLDIIKVEKYINYFDYISGSGKKTRQFNFLVKVNDGEIILTEHDEFLWVKLSEIQNINPMSKEAKQSFLIYKFNEENK